MSVCCSVSEVMVKCCSVSQRWLLEWAVQQREVLSLLPFPAAKNTVSQSCLVLPVRYGSSKVYNPRPVQIPSWARTSEIPVLSQMHCLYSTQHGTCPVVETHVHDARQRVRFYEAMLS